MMRLTGRGLLVAAIVTILLSGSVGYTSGLYTSKVALTPDPSQVGNVFTSAYVNATTQMKTPSAQITNAYATNLYVGTTPIGTYITNTMKGSEFQAWTYLFVIDGARYLAINGVTGSVDFNTTDAYDCIQGAIDSKIIGWGDQKQTAFLLGPGIWEIDHSLELPEECSLVGTGPDSTTILANGAIGAVITQKYSNYTWSVQIRDLRIDADNTANYGVLWSQTTCTLPSGHTYYCWLSLENLSIRQCVLNPIYQRRITTGFNTISFYNLIRTTGNIYMEGVFDSGFSNIYCSALHLKAVASNRYTDIYLGGGTAKTLWLYGGSPSYPVEKNTFISIRCDNPTNYALLTEDYVSENTFIGCVFSNHNNNAATNTYSAVKLTDNTTNNTFIGSVFCLDATPSDIMNDFKYWFEETGSSDYNLLVGCYFDKEGIGTAALSHAANTEHIACMGD